MKVPCPFCGAHFGDEYYKSLRCGFWKFGPYKEVPTAFRKKVWDYLMHPLADEMYEATGVAMTIGFLFHNVGKKQALKNTVEGYEEMPDKERRALQRKEAINQRGTAGIRETINEIGKLWRGKWLNKKNRK